MQVRDLATGENRGMVPQPTVNRKQTKQHRNSLSQESTTRFLQAILVRIQVSPPLAFIE